MAELPVFEIVPCVGIGPFRLGMSRQEVEPIVGELGLNNDGVTGRGGLGIDFDENERVVRIGICVFNGPVRLAIGGEPIDDLNDDAVMQLLARHISLSERNWTECEEAGLFISHWEDSDHFIFSVHLYAPGHRFPKASPVPGPAPRAAAPSPSTPLPSAEEAPPITREALLEGCREALDVWERCAADLCTDYEDGVVGLSHSIDRSLPRRSVEAIAAGSTDLEGLRKEWLEPIVALQDDDWSLPVHALRAFCACYNALEGLAQGKAKLLEIALSQARQARQAYPNPPTSQTRSRRPRG